MLKLPPNTYCYGEDHETERQNDRTTERQNDRTTYQLLLNSINVKIRNLNKLVIIVNFLF